MAYKTLLPVLDAGKTADACRDAAVILARQEAAHVTGVSLAVIPSRPIFIYHPSLSQVLAAQEESLRQDAEARAESFRAALDKQGLAGECQVERCFEHQCTEVIGGHARYADLIIMGQVTSEETTRRPLPEQVILDAGRPVLVVPHEGLRQSLGKRVAIAWDGGREAARAVADALPLVQRAELVELLVVDAEAHAAGHGAGAKFAQFLGRHGCQVEVRQLASAGRTVGASLLSHLTDHDADLLVMGGYAHARLRELVLGGVTRHVLEETTTPVLLSH